MANKSNPKHESFEQLNEYGNQRICYRCGLKEKKIWVNDTGGSSICLANSSEEM